MIRARKVPTSVVPMVTAVARHMSGRVTMAFQESSVKPTGKSVTALVLTAILEEKDSASTERSGMTAMTAQRIRMMVMTPLNIWSFQERLRITTAPRHPKSFWTAD